MHHDTTRTGRPRLAAPAARAARGRPPGFAAAALAAFAAAVAATSSTASALAGGPAGEPLVPRTLHCPDWTILGGEAVFSHRDLFNSGFAVTADLDGDGRDEVLVGNLDDDFGYVSIYRVSGGRFGVPERIVVDGVPDPSWIVADDLNGDGAPDVVVQSLLSGGGLAVLLNDGTGRLATAWTRPDSVDRADVRRGADGARSIVYRHPGQGLIELPLDAGGFPLDDVTIDPSAGSLSVAVDANGDGLEDVVNGPAGAALRLYLAQPDGTWGQPMVVGTAGNAMPRMLAADVTGDALEDIVYILSGGSSGGMIRVFENDPDAPGFLPAADHPIDVGGFAAFGIAAGDVNADGIPDVAAAFEFGTAVLLGTPAGDFENATLIPFGDSAVTVAIGDLDGDGVGDVVGAGRNDDAPTAGTIVAMRGRVGGAPGSIGAPRVESGFAYVDDLDGDGTVERLTNLGPELRLQRYDPVRRTFDTVSQLVFDATIVEYRPTVGPSAPAGRVLVRTSGGDPIEAVQVVGDELVAVESLDIGGTSNDDFVEGDFDGDGDLDLAVQSVLNGFEFLERVGDAFVPGPTIMELPPIWTAICHDFDDDGRADVLYTSLNGPERVVGILFGDADALAVDGGVTPNEGIGVALDVIDWDGDGVVEAVASGFTALRPVLVYVDDRRALQTATMSIEGIEAPQVSIAAAFGDLDGRAPIDAFGGQINAGEFAFVATGSGPRSAPVLDARRVPLPVSWDGVSALADVDGNGAADVVAFRNFDGVRTIVLEATPCPIPCRGDLDGSGAVDFLDLLRQLAFVDPLLFTPAGVHDLNDDGVRSFDDLMILLANWGPCGN